jgi:uncharacterized membrane protein HdeD (DUF308 family)
MEVDMSTIESTTQVPNASNETPTRMHLFLRRGVVAIVWAAVFAATSHSLTTAVTVGAGILLVLYPLIDVAACVIDARSQDGSVRQLLLAGAAVSFSTAVALGVAATRGVADVLTVFGVWATISGTAQLVVALRRRALLGNQWPMLLAGGGSVIGGLIYIIAATSGHPKLSLLVVYAATGGVEFVIQARLLARRRRLVHTVPV